MPERKGKTVMAAKLIDNLISEIQGKKTIEEKKRL